ncbi:hypothetical protein PT277_04565 [Acetobacteraceae bacterium ESL0709]|nr:hypothetical protein [Acetobacteraceae bacterium ESL0697]MDF7677969.1 hypothetical protein [Acetobacteraceae bacterium ESL0709]
MKKLFLAASFILFSGCTTSESPPKAQSPAQDYTYYHDSLTERRDADLAGCEKVPPPADHHIQEIVACKNTVWRHWAQTAHVGQDVVQPALDYNNVDLYAYLNGRMDSKTNALHFNLAHGAVDNRYKRAITSGDRTIIEPQTH